MTLQLIELSTGKARVSCSLVPPTIMAIVPAVAPLGPPLTGASINSMPSIASLAASSRVMPGSPVVISISIVPLLSAEATCCSPNKSDRRSSEVGRQVRTMSTDSASSAALLTTWASAPVNASTAVCDWSNTQSVWSVHNRRARGAPILPSPINPTCISTSFAVPTPT